MKFNHKIALFTLITGLILSSALLLINHFLGGNSILYIGAGILLFLGLQLFYLNRLMQGLFFTIKKIKNSKKLAEGFEFEPARFRELDDFQKEFKELSQYNHENYLSQKQYSENLSHELLTPLAIIRTKAELLMQAPDIREVDLLHLDSIIQTVGRLEKLNRALILLSKIDNNQFVDQEKIRIKSIVSESLENFEDQIRKKQLEVQVDFSAGVEIESNLNLVRILVSNLIKNAVFHNVENGFINIILTQESLLIENSGLINDKDPNLFFQRFVSDKSSENSIGLGLSIAKQICRLLAFKISYKANGNIHQLKIEF